LISGPGVERYAPAFTIHWMRIARKRPSLSKRELSSQLRRAAVVVGQEGLGTRRGPLHRLAGHLGSEHCHAVFRIGIRADPEPAAHILGVDQDFLSGNAGDAARASAHQRKALRAHIQVVLVGRRVVRGEAGLGSIGFPTTRWLSRAIRVTCAAREKASLAFASSPYS